MVHVSVVITAKPDYAWTFKTILRLIRMILRKLFCLTSGKANSKRKEFDPKGMKLFPFRVEIF